VLSMACSCGSMCKSMQNVCRISQVVSPAPLQVALLPVAVASLTRLRSRSRSALAWGGQASKRAVPGIVRSLC